MIKNFFKSLLDWFLGTPKEHADNNYPLPNIKIKLFANNKQIGTMNNFTIERQSSFDALSTHESMSVAITARKVSFYKDKVGFAFKDGIIESQFQIQPIQILIEDIGILLNIKNAWLTDVPINENEENNCKIIEQMHFVAESAKIDHIKK